MEKVASTYIHCHVLSIWLVRSCHITQGAQAGALRGVGRGEGREAQEGGDICIILAELHCCKAKTNTVLQSYIPPIK